MIILQRRHSGTIKISKRSLTRRLLRRIPIPLLALAFGLVTGFAVWVIVDRVQTRALSNIFDQALESQLDQQARESLIRFDEYRRSFGFFTQLIATHRRMADYLDPIIWSRHPVDIAHYDAGNPPPWLPRDLAWQGGISAWSASKVPPAEAMRSFAPSGGFGQPAGASLPPLRRLPRQVEDDPALARSKPPARFRHRRRCHAGSRADPCFLGHGDRYRPGPGRSSSSNRSSVRTRSSTTSTR